MQLVFDCHRIERESLPRGYEPKYKEIVTDIENLKAECGVISEKDAVHVLALRYFNDTSLEVTRGEMALEILIPKWAREEGSEFIIRNGLPIPPLKAGESSEVFLAILTDLPSLSLDVFRLEWTDNHGTLHEEFSGTRHVYVKTIRKMLLMSTSEAKDIDLKERNQEFSEYVEQTIGLESYFLMKNYLELPLPGRGLLMKTAFQDLKEIQDEKWRFQFKGIEKEKALHLVQLDLISKVMMLIEDLGAFCVAFLSGSQNLAQELLDRRSTAKINKFFSNLEVYSSAEILQILGFPAVSQIGLDDREETLFEKVFQIASDEIRRVLIELRDFRIQHRELYNKYKHGFSVMPYMSKSQGDLSDFESMYVVLHHKARPLEEALPIPYTPRALDAYEIIIQAVQTLLTNMLQLNLARIEMQEPSLLLPGIYSPAKLTEAERKEYRQIVERLHPPQREPVNHKLIIPTTISRKDVQWYLDLPSFLDACKKRADTKP